MQKDSQTAFEKEYSQKILTEDYYNGRVNIMEKKDPDAVFKMQERIGIKNKSTTYFSALAGNDWEENVLSKVFFSKENIQILQNGLRAGVYKKSNNEFMIGPQKIDNLKS